MCGIAGILSRGGAPVREAELRQMCAAMSHRGPDGEGIYLGAGVGLGMRRLSIIDLETGDQPVHNEDGSVWVVFNGEIYNFQELRRELLARGHRLYTATDTECLVHLYEEHGVGLVERLRGMFAFALWDERRRRLLLARDRLGIKPLYYAEVGRRLLFASELKCLLQLADVERRLDWGALARLLAFLATPATQSIVAGVRKLPPGHTLLASPEEGVRLARYWDVHFEPDRGRSEAECIDELRGLLEESVRLHMVSDVPLGAFLSGGIDSSSVVATMARLSAQPVKTFSIGFTDEGFSEAAAARVVARRFATDHHERILEPDVLTVLDELAYYLDEPFGDSSAIPTYMVAKLAAEHVKVVLSGDGGDELFGGYERYRVEAKERAFSLLPARLRMALSALARAWPERMRGHNYLRHVALDGHERYLDAGTLFRREEWPSLLRPEALAAMSRSDPWKAELELLARTNGDWLSALQYLDLNSYLPLDILTKVDRMSMAHSIEARVPLLDHKLVEFAARLPQEMRLHRGRTKLILKRAMRGVLPVTTIDRPKQGFAIPLGRWFRGRLREFVCDLLLAPTSRAREVFQPAALERLSAQAGRCEDLALKLWTLISFELWCRTFLDGKKPPVVAPPPVARRSVPLVTTFRRQRAGQEC